MQRDLIIFNLQKINMIHFEEYLIPRYLLLGIGLFFGFYYFFFLLFWCESRKEKRKKSKRIKTIKRIFKIIFISSNSHEIKIFRELQLENNCDVCSLKTFPEFKFHLRIK